MRYSIFLLPISMTCWSTREPWSQSSLMMVLTQLCVPSYKIQRYSYHHVDQKGIKNFGDWLRIQKWDSMAARSTSTAMVDDVHQVLADGVSRCFILKTRSKKSSEPAWMTDWLQDLIEDRRKVFYTDKGRSERWAKLKKRTARIVKERRSKFYAHILQKLETDNNPGNFFKHVEGLLGANCKPRWTPHSMYPDMEPDRIAEELADFFNSISSEYLPLDMSKIPSTYNRSLPAIMEADVTERIKKVKKPNSVIPGDIPPILYFHLPAELSIPITILFNKITKDLDWPTQWKTEYVTGIPKGISPSDPSECRNISCTNFMFKLYEAFVLSWSREEVKPKNSQYGGEPGASAAHLLVEVLDDITSTLEDNRMGVALSSIDFSKAFNRLDHSHCLRTLAARGASNSILRLLGSFLSGRTMTVKVDCHFSEPHPVNARAPQGSVLGCYLFNIGVDDLEEGFDGGEQEQEEAHKETLCNTADFPAASTPKRVRNLPEATLSPIASRKQSFELLPRVANIPPWVLKPKDPRLKDRGLRSYKFVDNSVITSPVNMRSALLLEDGDGPFKKIEDKRMESLLSHVAGNAVRKGMKINAKKTNLMCVSAATPFRPLVQIQLEDQMTSGQDKMKILGVIIDSDCSFRSHVENVRINLRRRTWALSKLRRYGVKEDKLVRAYTSLIRPVVEYAAPAWHSLITAEQSELLECQQTQALKNIFGVGLSAATNTKNFGFLKVCQKMHEQ